MVNQTEQITLEDIGYSDFFKEEQKNIVDNVWIPARVILEHKEAYVLRTQSAELSAKITGKMMFNALSREDYPAVGDWVLIEEVGGDEAVIKTILPRKTALKRKASGNSSAQVIAANIDVAFIVQSTDRDYSLNRFERYVSLVRAANIAPVLVLNKADLLSDLALEVTIEEIKARFDDTAIYTTSTLTGNGIAQLKRMVQAGRTYCFVGSSGVGKSSIINSFIGENKVKTGEISEYANRGKHVTTHRELFILADGGLLIDNPGMREIGVLDSDKGIKDVFSEIRELEHGCKFGNCTHVDEPNCAVIAAVDSGRLDSDKYSNYLTLLKENQYNTMSRLEKRQKDRKFGKFIKTTKKQLKRYKGR